MCSSLYLRRIGIIKDGNSSTQVCFVGKLALHSAVSFLHDLDLRTPRLSLICDLFHASTFLSDIIHFLKNHPIRALEMLFLDDELDILENPAFSDVIRSILGAFAPTCEQVSFVPHIRHVTRTLPSPSQLNLGPGPSVASRLTPIIRRAIGSVTEFRLSSAFSCFGHLWNIFALFLQSSSIEIVSLDCRTSAESCSILQSMVLPSLQMLSIVTHDNGLPLIPASFIRHHPRLKTASLLNLHSWDAPDSLCLTPTHLSLPALSHLTISSNYSSFEIQDISSFEIQDISRLSRLDVVSFITLPVPGNRGYCDVVESLTRAVRYSSCSSRFLTISFTFPRLLDAHIRFCKENPIYRCSCSPLSLRGRLLKNIRNVEICVDVLSGEFVVKSLLEHLPIGD